MYSFMCPQKKNLHPKTTKKKKETNITMQNCKMIFSMFSQFSFYFVWFYLFDNIHNNEYSHMKYFISNYKIRSRQTSMVIVVKKKINKF